MEVCPGQRPSLHSASLPRMISAGNSLGAGRLTELYSALFCVCVPGFLSKAAFRPISLVVLFICLISSFQEYYYFPAESLA